MNYVRRVSVLTVGLGLACGSDDGGSAGGETSAATAMTAGTSAGPGSADGSPSGPTSAPSTESGQTGDSGSGSTGGSLACPHAEVAGMPTFGLELAASGFDRPLQVLSDPGHPGRLYVVEQGGRIRVVEPETAEPSGQDLMLVPSDAMGCDSLCGDTGTLSMAFHPDYPDDPRIYVEYFPSQGPRRTRIAEFMVGADGAADPGSERVILEIDQPRSNHNGGMIAFGNDGYLYIGMGDGGGQNNELMTGRDTGVLHSKMLRIGVEPDGEPDDPVGCSTCATYGPFDYTIPDDNPFLDQPSFAPEIWAYGFREPWRWHFDRQTGDLWLADVGQDLWEWVSILGPGTDHGWDFQEGATCFMGSPCDDAAAPNTVNADGITMPIYVYAHQGGRASITGGAVYRSCEVPGWDGVYFFADYASREMLAVRFQAGVVDDFGAFSLDVGERIVGSGLGGWGDVYFTTVEEAFPNGPLIEGKVWRVAPAD